MINTRLQIYLSESSKAPNCYNLVANYNGKKFFFPFLFIVHIVKVFHVCLVQPNIKALFGCQNNKIFNDNLFRIKFSCVIGSCFIFSP